MRDGGAGCVKAMCIGPSVRPIAPCGSHYIEALNVNKLADLKEDIWIADAANNFWIYRAWFNKSWSLERECRIWR